MAATEASEGTSTAEEPVADSPEKLRYALKTSLSLTLAYLVPMAMGWSQPQTAAITVMLIAATGMVSESLQKGVLRILGTLAGAVIGLSLIALFPQDRMLYLLVVSCTVAVIVYLYNAYQRDSTVFMLTAVVTLMVFNGGDAEGAFIYGVDRAFMTAFGVIIYTLVGSMLWPVRLADNTRNLAAGLNRRYREAFSRLTLEGNAEEKDAFLAALLSAGNDFDAHFASIKNHTDGVTDYLPEWTAVAGAYKALENMLLPALQQDPSRSVDYGRYIENYDNLLGQVDTLFMAISAAWQGHRQDVRRETLAIEFNREQLRQGSHLEAAAVVSRAELLHSVQKILLEVLAALDSLLLDRGHFVATLRPSPKPAFVWLDLENLKTALRALITFWIAAGIWMMANPPGGYMFVTMCTVLIPLVSYTPVTPKLLVFLFSLGFLFALPAYAFLLPQMTHWLELGLFLFTYAFIGFYVFQGAVSIFFLLGLFTLGIQNEMSYAFDGILLTITMFYMVCATLIVSVNVPFSSKPHQLYMSLRGRFFRLCARKMRLIAQPRGLGNSLGLLLLGSGEPLLVKMAAWGAKIDGALLPVDGTQLVAKLNRHCELLHGELQALEERRQHFLHNPLIKAARHSSDGVLAELCDRLADFETAEHLENLRSAHTRIEARLDELLGENYLDTYDAPVLAQFYVYLNLHASIFNSIVACMETQQALDRQRLAESRF